MITTPQEYIHEHPPKHAIQLGGAYVDITKLAEEQGFNVTYLSKILNGKSIPSVPYLQRLSRALGMSMDGLLLSIDARRLENLEKAG